MRNMLHLLRDIWNFPKSRADAYSHVAGQLQPIPVSQGGPAEQLQCDDWCGVVFELNRPASPDAVEDFSRQLLCTIGSKVELAVVTHTSPLNLSSEVAAYPGQQRVTSAGFEPTIEQYTSVKSYLFVRIEATGARALTFSSAHLALYQAGLYRRTLTKTEVLGLLEPWCRVATDSDDVVAIHTASPGARFTNPLQVSERLTSHPVETLTCLQLSVPGREGPNGVSYVGSFLSTLVRGKMVAVTLEAVEQTHSYRKAGVNLQRASDTRSAASVPALPWLTPLLPMQALILNRTPAKVPLADVFTQLPLVWGSSPLCEVSPDRSGLRVHDHAGAPLYLNSWNYHAPGNMLIQGVAGSGLTFTAKSLMAAHLEAGGTGWYLGYESPNPIFTEAHKGKSVSLDNDTPFSLNPLAGFGSALEYEDAEPTLIAWLCALGGQGELASQYHLQQALRKAWQFEREGLGLSAVLAEIDALGGPGTYLADRIRANVRGLSPAWFEGPSSWEADSNSAYVEVSVSALSDSGLHPVLGSAVLALCALSIEKADYRQPKLLVIDDLEILNTPGITNLLTATLRRARIRNVRVVLTSRCFSADPGEQRPIERAAAENTHVKVLLQMSPGYEEGWLKQLPKEQQHEFRVRGRAHRGLIRMQYLDDFSGQYALAYLKVSPNQRLLLTPKLEERRRYLTARHAGLSSGEALEQLMP